MRAGRAGHSLPELLVALFLGGVVLGALAISLSGTERLARWYGHRIETAEAIRTAAALLGAELRYVDPAADLRQHGPNTLGLRVFRGAAIVCGTETGVLRVRYRGLRDPDPEKDSVLVLDGAGRTRALALIGSAPANPAPGGPDPVGPAPGATGPVDPCTPAPGEKAQRWTLPEHPPVATLLLLFESGDYHLSDGALRYRRGLSGRQPLTAEVFDDAASTLRVVAHDRGDGGLEPSNVVPAAVEATFVSRPPPSGRGRGAGLAARYRFPLLNARTDDGGEP